MTDLVDIIEQAGFKGSGRITVFVDVLPIFQYFERRMGADDALHHTARGRRRRRSRAGRAEEENKDKGGLGR